jgi:hypothetical protein
MFTIYSIIIINKMYLRSLNSARILRKAARALLPRPDQHVEVIEPESYSVMERRKFGNTVASFIKKL